MTIDADDSAGHATAGTIPDETTFRREVAEWMADHLIGDFAVLRHRGGPGDEHAFVADRMAWERELAEGGWTWRIEVL